MVVVVLALPSHTGRLVPKQLVRDPSRQSDRQGDSDSRLSPLSHCIYSFCPLGMFYLLVICVLAFTDAVCIIKYRLPSEDAHHPFMKCSQQQLFEQAESLPIPPPPHLAPLHHSSHHQGGVPGSMMASPSSPLPPPPPLNHCYAPKSDASQFHAV